MIEEGQVKAPIELEERHSHLRIKERDSGLIFGSGSSGVKAESADDFKMFGRGVLKDSEDEFKFRDGFSFLLAVGFTGESDR